MKSSKFYLKYDCRHFRGDVPCKPHKLYGVHCFESGKVCKYYDIVKTKILIIKLGAIGDVIRTTPLIRKFKEIYKNSEIWWLTLTPEVLPNEVDFAIPFNFKNILVIEETSFDVAINLDKDKEACALISRISAKIKKGYILKDGKCSPINKAAEHKYLTGLFDDISKKNRKSYQEEIFEICGCKFNGEEYLLPPVQDKKWKLPKNKIIVGLNTGCGGRWTSRLWPDRYWIDLARRLKNKKYIPLLLGGEQEHEKNLKISRKSKAIYLGYFPIDEFISLMNQCDVVISGVTMGMHIAIGLRKKLVLLNNIFNKYEFELYGRGVIVEPDFECNCYYSPVCENNCMQYLTVNSVFNACQRLIIEE